MIVDAEVPDELAQVICPYPPTPQQSLFFYINDQISMQKEGGKRFCLQPRSVVVGPQVTRVNLIVGKKHKAVRVGFHPGGLYRLLGIPMNNLFDQGFDTTTLIGVEMENIVQQLQEAPDYETIKNVVERFLLQKSSRLKTALPFDVAMKDLVQHNGNIPIEKIASISCLSLRQFERKCAERIGMPPKLFSRVIRFSNAYRLYEKQPELKWTSIAYECGYFDQMHLIRDFKEFAGVTPLIIKGELSTTPFRLQKDIQL
jgi:AraC-like DNA-binding protein